MKPRVVIIGAGFGGLWATRALADAAVEITLIDKNNYHSFLPLLYQVAAAEIEAEQIAYPVRQIVRKQKNVRFVMAAATGVDWKARVVATTEGDFPFDYLLLALGSKTHYFRVPGAAEHSFSLKTLPDALKLRHHILRCFEQAAVEPDPARRRQLLTFAIVGGGPTGVEYAGALRELIRRPLARDFAQLDMEEVRVILIEGRDRLLGHLPEKLSRYTERRLRRMEVELWFEQMVSGVSADGVTLRSGDALAAATVVWTAGVSGETLAEKWDLPTAGAGQVPVHPTLQVPGMDHVFAIGDMAYLEQDGAPLPMLAQPAMQQGTHVGRNIERALAGKPLKPFRYRDLGTMATIGRNSAVAELGPLRLTGFVAWIIWLFIHLMNLVGFRNRLVVLINWAWDYFFYDRIARLILEVPVETPTPTAPTAAD